MDIKDIKSKTVAQLKEIAKELGITGISDMKKADRKSTRLNSSHIPLSRMPSSA